jgi:hypothetical protein
MPCEANEMYDDEEVPVMPAKKWKGRSVERIVEGVMEDLFFPGDGLTGGLQVTATGCE